MAEGQKRQKVSHTLLPHQTSFLHLVHKRTAPLGKERDFKELDDVYRFAGENGFSAAVGSLLKGMSLYDRSDFMWEVVPDGQFELVQVLLQHGALVDRCHHITGRTPLMSACQRGQQTLSKLLLDWGANFDALHSDGSTPWTFVVRIDDVYMADYMLAKGANPNASAEGLIRVLWLACLSGSYEVAKKLIEKGADVREVVNNMSILHIACQTHNFNIAKFLIRQNYKLEFIDSPYIRVPLFAACVSTKPEAVEVVAEMVLRGVQMNYVRETCRMKAFNSVRIFATPLHLAVEFNIVRMVWTLVSLGGHTVVSFPYVKGDRSITVWELSNNDKSLTEALYNRWSPRSHQLFPKPVRDAIISLLLVNNRKQLYIPIMILRDIFSYIAYGWLPLNHPAMQPVDDRLQIINCQGSIKGTIQENTSQFSIVT